MFRKLCVSAAALLAASLCMGGSAQAASDPKTGAQTDQLQAVVQPSIVYESITWKGFVWDVDNHKYIGKNNNAKQFTVKMQCTGYVVNPEGWIATAGHCVDTRDGKKAVIETAAQWAVANGFYVFGTTVDSLIQNQHYRVNTFDDDDKLKRNTVDRTVVASWGAAVSGVDIEKSKPAFVRAFHKHEDGDAALLKVDETDLNAIKLGNSENVSINDDVVAIGYPAIIDSYTDADLTPTFDPGTITSRKTVADGLLPVLQMSAQLSGGMSGGPTVTPDGTVIGTNVSHFPGEPFNYAIPIEQVKELMDSTGVDNDLSATTQKYREGVSAYYAKNRTQAVKNLQAVVDEQPGNGFASDLLKKSKDLPKPKPKDTGSNALLFIGLGVLLLLLIIGGVVAVLLTRRNKGPKPIAGQAAAPGAPGAPAVLGWCRVRRAALRRRTPHRLLVVPCPAVPRQVPRRVPRRVLRPDRVRTRPPPRQVLRRLRRRGPRPHRPATRRRRLPLATSRPASRRRRWGPTRAPRRRAGWSRRHRSRRTAGRTRVSPRVRAPRRSPPRRSARARLRWATTSARTVERR